MVTDRDSGEPVAGVPVTLAFQGGAGIANPTAITGPDGSYSLGPVPVGTYPKLQVNGAGFQPVIQPVTVTAAGGKGDFQVRKDWAAESGGASVADFNGPDFSDFGCGPAQAIDLSQATGWGEHDGRRRRHADERVRAEVHGRRAGPGDRHLGLRCRPVGDLR